LIKAPNVISMIYNNQMSGQKVKDFLALRILYKKKEKTAKSNK